MRWWLLSLLVLAVPFAHAAGYTGWHYQGDTFKYNDVLYTVESFGYDKLLLGVGSTSYLLSIGECKETMTMRYCYKESAYPDDEDHIKYAGGKQYYGYNIEISPLAPTLEVTRTFSVANPEIDEEVDVKVTLKNTADVTVQNVLYREPIPENVRAGGPHADYGYISYNIETLIPGSPKIFAYTLRAQGYVNTNLRPNVTYEYNGRKYEATVTAQTFSVATPLETGSSITNTVNLDQVGNYTLNLTNKDEDREIEVQAIVTMPPALRIVKLDGFTQRTPGVYVADLRLAKKEATSLQILFVSSVGGTYKIPVNITAYGSGSTFKKHYEETVTAKADRLNPVISLSSTRTTYRSGDKLTISGILENRNAVTTFRGISGTLSAPGLFNRTEFSHQEFSPRRNLTEAEQTITLPAVNETKAFTITLSGHYATPGGETFTYEATRTINVAPSGESVSISRTIEPAAPAPGQNFTVTVSGTNKYNQFIMFSTQESYDPQLVKLGGITYYDGSLERDRTRQLYLYQLRIPDDYAAEEINLSTTVTPKDAPEQRYTTTIKLGARNTTAVINETKNETAQAPVVVETQVKQRGFWGRIWDNLKGVFKF